MGGGIQSDEGYQGMQDNRVSDIHFSATTGYGIMIWGGIRWRMCMPAYSTVSALVRPQLMSGTHALHVALSGATLRPGMSSCRLWGNL